MARRLTARSHAPPHRETEMLAQVRQAGLKLTPQRMAIVRELAADTTHPTAQELFDRLRPALPTMSFATVYNTLATLVEAGLCKPRALTPGPVRFDPKVGPHDHAVCERCGRVLDVAGVVEASSPAIEGFRVRAVERIYRGTCAECAGGAQPS